MKLMPQLVPKPLWGINAHRKLSRDSWQSIRQDALEAAGHRCEICRAPPPRSGSLTCHEVWRYDDGCSTAVLVGLETHCAKCDTATHMGRAIKRGVGDVALAQLCHVNRITESEARQIFTRAIATWKERNGKEWRVTVDETLLRRYPRLAALKSS